MMLGHDNFDAMNLKEHVLEELVSSVDVFEKILLVDCPRRWFLRRW